MKYLRKFETADEVMMVVTPNVVLVKDTGTVLYNVPRPANGVYIQHVNGGLYTTEQWSAQGFANNLANGVALLSEQASFVIGKEKVSFPYWSSNNSEIIQGIMATTNLSTAKTDFSGKRNTEIMLETDTGGAAYVFSNYSFPNGSKGYLPALGELDVANTHRSAINAAMAVIGGTILDGPARVSTQYNSTMTWWYKFGKASGGSQSKTSQDTTYIFTEL